MWPRLSFCGPLLVDTVAKTKKSKVERAMVVEGMLMKGFVQKNWLGFDGSEILVF